MENERGDDDNIQNDESGELKLIFVMRVPVSLEHDDKSHNKSDKRVEPVEKCLFKDPIFSEIEGAVKKEKDMSDDIEPLKVQTEPISVLFFGEFSALSEVAD